jgi:hypothetical protein
MTLERWSVQRYRLPRLDVRAIRMLDDGLELDSPRGVFTLSCGDEPDAKRALLPMLDALRDPRSELWSAIRGQAQGTSELMAMLRELDHCGLILDGSPADAGGLHSATESVVREWIRRVGDDLASRGPTAISVVEQLSEQLSADANNDLSAILQESSFPILTLRLQAQHLRDSAPAVLEILIEALCSALRRARGGHAIDWWTGIRMTTRRAAEDWACGLVNPRCVELYLIAVDRMVGDVLGPGAPRRARCRTMPGEPISGINFLVALEAEVSRWFGELGTSPLVTALQDAPLARRVVRAAFLQEYLVTCRFVDCIAPLLSRRFDEPLRDAIHRYFGEEMGHEKLEREHCMQLGFTEHQIDEAIAPPLHLAFVDILTCIARESPIGFFCASVFTEGMFGTNHSLVSLAQQVMSDEPALVHALSNHVAINDESDHRGIGRDWMSRVPVVGLETQATVSELMAYMTELNWRMWDQLVQSCAVNSAAQEGS